MAEAMMPDEDGYEDYEDDDLTYPMLSSPKGICLIINNRDFANSGPNSAKLETRSGTDADRDALELTFKGLNFKVECCDNLTNTEMIHIMYEMAKRDHQRFDCFVCCILSHGSLGKVYGSNGEGVEILDLTKPLKPNSCPSLTDKPKVFFLQACQGAGRQRGYTALESDALATERELIPNESDFLIAHSTVPGFESYRDTQKGSVYIQTLARTLSKHSGLEIHDVLTKVNYAVGHKTNKVYGENSGYKQSPAPLYTLRKRLILGQVVQGVNPLNNLLTQCGTGTSSFVVSDERERSTEPRQSPPEKTGQEGIIHDLLQKAEGMKPHFEWLTHAYKCQNSSGCKQPRCREMKHVMEHMKTCTRGQSCKALHCAAVSPFLVHVSSCMYASWLFGVSAIQRINKQTKAKIL